MDNIETSPTTITTSWSFPPDATGSEVSWELTGQMRRRRVSNAEGGTSGRLPKDQNSYTIGRLRSGTSYDITVTVFNPAGNSSTTFTHSTAEGIVHIPPSLSLHNYVLQVEPPNMEPGIMPFIGRLSSFLMAKNNDCLRPQSVLFTERISY